MSLGARQLHDHLAMPLIPIVASVGLRGLPVNVALRDNTIFSLGVRIATLDARLRAAGIVEPGSSQRCERDLLRLGVPLSRKTESGARFKVDAEVVGRLNFHHNTERIAAGKPPRFPFLADLLMRRKLEKATANLQSLEVCDDGMLRTRLQAVATATARYASAGFGTRNKPGFCPICRVWGRHGTNCQNLARPDPLTGVNIKDVFVARPGWRLGELDMSAFEIVIQAERIGGPLLERIRAGAPLHDMHTRGFYGHGKDDVLPATWKKQRTTMKNVFYGMRGGGGDNALLSALAKAGEFFSLADVRKFRAYIESEYPEQPEWIASTDVMLRRQLQRGERRIIRNGFGRPRVLLGADPLKAALATEISGTAAEIMNFILLRLAREHPDEFAYVVLQIHDSFLVYAPVRVFDHVMRVVRDEMQRPVWLWGRFVTFECEPKATDDGGAWSRMKAWAA